MELRRSAARGALLGLAYSLGLGIPFILITLGFGWATRSVAFLRRHIRTVNIIGGGLLIVLGVLMVTGVWTALMAQLQGVFLQCPAPALTVRRTPHRPVEGTLRPADHADSSADARMRHPTTSSSPPLGVVGWLRWGWRQLTSMRTALVLLLLLAIAAVPGSHRAAAQRRPERRHAVLRRQPRPRPDPRQPQLFDVYTSPWFSAIYILLFVSLIGCVIPRTKHHWKALRARPPRTPARLERLDAHRESIVELAPEADAAAAGDRRDRARRGPAEEGRLPRRALRLGRRRSRSRPSAGYLRETGNLVFHAALIGVLLAVGVGGGFTYTGQSVIIEGRTFVNTMLDYASFNPGRFVDEEKLTPVLADARRVRRHVPAGRHARAPGRPATSPPTSPPQIAGEDAADRARCASTTRSRWRATAST